MNILLKTKFCNIEMPNPFMIASGPPSNTAKQVLKAFEAGWGGVVWKTIGVSVQNVSAGYAAIKDKNSKMFGMNNIELISDRLLNENLDEIKFVKDRYKDRCVIVSVMAEYSKESWQNIAKLSEDTGCDGLELNLSCPHGLNEQGLGSVYGQDPDLTEEVTSWVKEITKLPVLVKLTPNISDILIPAKAAVKGGADGISLINTINSIMGVDLETLVPNPNVDGKSTNGGYCGPAIKPIAIYHLSRIAGNKDIGKKISYSGIGGIETWQDAAEYMLMGASTVQICTAVMRNGFGIIENLKRGLCRWMIKKNFLSINDFIGKSLDKIVPFNELNKQYKVTAEINQKKCINCGLCYSACNDGCYQSIIKEHARTKDHFFVDKNKCVGCGMCEIVCPVKHCITLS